MQRLVLLLAIMVALSGSAVAGNKGGRYYSSPNQYQTYGTQEKNSRMQRYSASTGSTWSFQSVDGRQSGINSQGQSWSYDENTGVYQNYGTGELRFRQPKPKKPRY